MGDELDETSFPSFDYGVTQVEVSSSMIMVRFSREVRRSVGLGRPPSITVMFGWDVVTHSHSCSLLVSFL